MKNKDQKLFEKIMKNTVPFEEVFGVPTPEEQKIMEEEAQRYYMLLELKKMRKKSGLTQKQLAEKADLPRTTITKIESGIYNPTVNTLVSIACAMDKKLQVKFL